MHYKARAEDQGAELLEFYAKCRTRFPIEFNVTGQSESNLERAGSALSRRGVRTESGSDRIKYSPFDYSKMVCFFPSRQ